MYNPIGPANDSSHLFQRTRPYENFHPSAVAASTPHNTILSLSLWPAAHPRPHHSLLLPLTKHSSTGLSCLLLSIVIEGGP